MCRPSWRCLATTASSKPTPISAAVQPLALPEGETDMADTNPEYGTIIGADANFKGELSFDSAAKLLGKFEGTINSKGRIHVADGSQCKATVKAKEISVEGHIEGNVEAADRVELKNKGAITGDVVASRMVMAEGASIDGHCRIGVNGHARSASTTETKPAMSGVSASQPQPVKK
jgi:cytoskeletal protein CcmA (bactofilin family)